MAVSLNRQHPLSSPVGCLATLVLLGGLSIAVVVSGGAVFSPGPLSAMAVQDKTLNGFASHAEFENDCGQCHAPFRGIEAARCEQCHRSVAVDRASGIGLHGGLGPEIAARCGACHSDHKGRDFDPIDIALVNFDHSLAFSLDGAHASVSCTDCHASRMFKGTPAECVACHAEPEIHAGLFSPDCATCHTTAAWVPAQFTLAHTFPLNHGEQGRLACSTCHEKTFRDYACYQCHEQTEMTSKHAEEGIGNARLQNCIACHATGEEEEREENEG